jgi:hypothetical protein
VRYVKNMRKDDAGLIYFEIDHAIVIVFKQIFFAIL